MHHRIFIDTGTTNSRIRLLDSRNGKIMDTYKLAIGVKNAAVAGTNQILKEKLADGIKQLLENNQLQAADIRFIAASGMITSGLGLHEVPHVEAPATLSEVASNAEIKQEKCFLSIPTVYIPGMKNRIDGLADINDYDVMRGEEVETYGLLQQILPEGKGLMILPGSHTKYVFVEEEQTIRSCMSTLGGEMLQAISEHTILAGSLDSQLIKTVDAEALEKGFQAASTYGLTRSLYQVRLLDLFSEWTINQRANYLVGAVLYEDMKSLQTIVLEKSQLDWVIVGGSDPLRKAFSQLLNTHFTDWHVMEATDEQVDRSSVLGAWEVASVKFPE
ncbi:MULTISPECIES: 2-dehydro-3-deoxygalactonokinase [Sediminibacillus]|uniref:2-dehydro-3-deoxygalactonokinase n=1 Tax=Sediminibacillus TaxID=482460 RepID=UPI001386E5EC|nr:2-dehydro-3-deoxygalactonokinase [Sediminibacillus terrae]